jgi:hypothetical protein
MPQPWMADTHVHKGRNALASSPKLDRLDDIAQIVERARALADALQEMRVHGELAVVELGVTRLS